MRRDGGFEQGPGAGVVPGLDLAEAQRAEQSRIALSAGIGLSQGPARLFDIAGGNTAVDEL